MNLLDDKEVLRCYRETGDNIYLEILLKKYTPYIRKISFSLFERYKNKYQLDDIMQEVIIEFIKISKYKFDINNSCSFFSYMYKVLKFSALNFIRDDKYFPAKRQDRLKHFDSNVSFFDDISINFKDGIETTSEVMDLIIPNDSRTVEQMVECNVLLEKIRKRLSDEEFELFYDYMVKEISQNKIAKKRNTTQALINKKINKKIKELESNIYLY